MGNKQGCAVRFPAGRGSGRQGPVSLGWLKHVFFSLWLGGEGAEYAGAGPGLV